VPEPLEPSGFGGSIHSRPGTQRSMTPTDDPGEPGAPLRGLRILDFSRILAGPLCTQVLGDLGADVVKVERPGEGDDTRQWGPPFVGDDAAYFLSLNRNKRSIALDLRSPDGAGVALRLARTADVVIENFRPGLMESFGLALDDLHADNPGLVSCSLTAFEGTEDAARPGYDIIVQALSGLMSVTGEPGGEPTKVGVALLDVITGLYAAVGILAALEERPATGRGRHVIVSLYGASVAAMVNQAANYLLGGVVPVPMGSAHPNIVPYQVFNASDRPFVLAAGNDKLFRLTCEVVGRAEWADEERFATNGARVRGRDQLIPLLADIFATRTAAAWLEALEARGVPCSPIRRMDEVFASREGGPLVETIKDPIRGPLRLVTNPIRIAGQEGEHRPPPLVGEHTEEILRELERRESEQRERP
jgi:crotonobetainyl-CoA:carnitine CoA-transferase CaiB-like acyl-CoA transferase